MHGERDRGRRWGDEGGKGRWKKEVMQWKREHGSEKGDEEGKGQGGEGERGGRGCWYAPCLAASFSGSASLAVLPEPRHGDTCTHTCMDVCLSLTHTHTGFVAVAQGT